MHTMNCCEAQQTSLQVDGEPQFGRQQVGNLPNAALPFFKDIALGQCPTIETNAENWSGSNNLL